MPTVVGVKLRFAPKVLWFDPSGIEPLKGDSVIVETERGTEIGEVVEEAHEVGRGEVHSALKPVVRIADESDVEHAAALLAEERAAMPVFRELVGKHKLDMKPVAAEFLFGDDKVVFYFSAEERVDFRELVRDLASRFRQRIDMRQVGVRDEARMVGGLGHCGQQLCCDRFSGDFQPVSIRMAKEQDLPLNPLKISGLCGRLMCCLRYEYDAYKDYKGRAPKRGAMIETPFGEGKVVDLNTPRETVTVRIPEAGNLTVPLSVMECGSGKGCPCCIKREALEEAQVVLPASMSSQLERDSTAEEMPVRKPRPERTERPARERTDKKRGKPREQQAPKPAAQKAASPKATAPEAAKAAEGDATQGAKKAPSSGRRRRRRRSGGTGSGTTGTEGGPST
ncbi:MAG: stage 0 sporulation family protein [Actinomycetota bacterium]|nr:stage 0 sporulation family protein [Actinomycetota bacterium]